MTRARRSGVLSLHFHAVALLVAVFVISFKESQAFSLVMTRQAVQLTKPPTILSSLQSSSSAAATQRRSTPRTPLRYRHRDDEAETNVSIQTVNPPRVSSSIRKSRGTARAVDQTQEHQASSFHLQIPIVGAILITQAATLAAASLLVAAVLFFSGHAAIDFNSLHWNWGTSHWGFFDMTMTPLRIMEGVLAALPMVYVGTMVEQSDQRDESHVNFSTMNMVMTLFGRRTNIATRDDRHHYHPELPQASMMHVMFLVAAISLVTGIAEELVFRGEIPFLMAYVSHSPVLALLGQAVLFGMGHWSSKATPGENRVVTSLQTLNGLWYGLVYLMTGGDVLPCIIAHTLYDAHVFMETWMTTNTQMDYTDVMAAKIPEEQEEIQAMQSQSNFLSDETLDFTKRFFYAFDYEHKGSLSRSDLQRAVSYAFLQDKVQPTPERVNKLFDKALRRRQKQGISTENELQQRLRLTDFVRVLFALKGNPQGANA